MHVSQILKMKGSAVITVTPEMTIAEAVETLSHRHIGAALVIAGKDRLAGILSERDIVHGLADHGAHVLTMHVSDIMTKAVVSCAPENTIDEIMHEMTNRRFRHMPVLDEGRLVGLISIGDVVKYRLEELSAESDMLRNYIVNA